MPNMSFNFLMSKIIQHEKNGSLRSKCHFEIKIRLIEIRDARLYIEGLMLQLKSFLGTKTLINTIYPQVMIKWR